MPRTNERTHHSRGTTQTEKQARGPSAPNRSCCFHDSQACRGAWLGACLARGVPSSSAPACPQSSLLAHQISAHQVRMHGRVKSAQPPAFHLGVAANRRAMPRWTCSTRCQRGAHARPFRVCSERVVENPEDFRSSPAYPLIFYFVGLLRGVTDTM